MDATNNGFRVGVTSLKRVDSLSIKKILIFLVVIIKVATAETQNSTEHSVAVRHFIDITPRYWSNNVKESTEGLNNSEYRQSSENKRVYIKLGIESYRNQTTSVKPKLTRNYFYNLRFKRHVNENITNGADKSISHEMHNKMGDSTNVIVENEKEKVTIDNLKVNIDSQHSIEVIKVSDNASKTADKIADQLQAASHIENIEEHNIINVDLKKYSDMNAPNIMTYNASDANSNGLVVLNETSNQTFTQPHQRSSKLPVVPKCCPLGQNLSQELMIGERSCTATNLSFNPLFYESNDTFIWEYESTEWHTLVGNPCQYDRYKLDSSTNSNDEFYLLVNGSMLAPYQNPQTLGPRDYCMETFWHEADTDGVTLPLVCFTTPPTEKAAASDSFIAYAVGLLISVPFLLTTALSYLLVEELRNNHGMALACHCLSLALAFSCLAATQLAGHLLPNKGCLVVAFLIQFSFVASFFWLNVMCFDTWLIITHHLTKEASLRRRRCRFLLYSAYAWILPLALLVVTMIMDLSPTIPSSFLKPNFATSGCWFQTDQSALPYFYGPVGVLLGSNVILFVLTSRSLARHKEYLSITQAELTMVEEPRGEWLELELPRSASIGGTNGRERFTKEDEHQHLRYRWLRHRKLFWMVCMLFLVMGLSWALDIISWLVGGPPLVWSIIDAINSLQGIIIFTIYVLQETARDIIWSRVKENCCSCCSKSRGKTMVSERSSFIYESAEGFMTS